MVPPLIRAFLQSIVEMPCRSVRLRNSDKFIRRGVGCSRILAGVVLIVLAQPADCVEFLGGIVCIVGECDGIYPILT